MSIRRITSPAEVVEHIDNTLGFRPADSVVVMATGTAGFLARVDWSPGQAEPLVVVAQAFAINVPSSEYVMVAYTEQEFETLWLEVIGASLFGRQPKAVLHVSSTEVWCDGQHMPCPTSPIAAASRDEMAATLDLATPLEMGATLDLATPLVEVGQCTMTGRELLDWAWEHAPGLYNGSPMPDPEAVTFLHAVADTSGRDGTWGFLTRDTAAEATFTLRQLATRTPGPYRHRLMGVLAFASWLAGDGALAWCAIDRAGTDNLAAMVAEALTSAIPPSTWKPCALGDLHTVKEES